MPLSISLKTQEEFNNLIKGRDLKISKAIVESILDNIDSKKRYIYVLEIKIEDEETVIDLTVDRQEFVHTLEKNLEIYVENELYEECSVIQQTIKKLKQLKNK
jgi:hypothetical protein